MFSNLLFLSFIILLSQNLLQLAQARIRGNTLYFKITINGIYDYGISGNKSKETKRKHFLTAK